MPDTAPEEAKSKSQIKREMQALRDLGRKLAELPPAMLDKVELSESTREAIVAARSMKREALRRQLSHIGGLMRREDAALVEQTLDQLARPHLQAVRAEHQLEIWRDGLIAGDNEVMTDLLNTFPGLDRQHLRQLVRNAIRERDQDKPPKAARSLFRYLRELRDERS